MACCVKSPSLGRMFQSQRKHIFVDFNNLTDFIIYNYDALGVKSDNLLMRTKSDLKHSCLVYDPRGMPIRMPLNSLSAEENARNISTSVE